MVVGNDVPLRGVNNYAGAQRHEFAVGISRCRRYRRPAERRILNGEPPAERESSPKNCWKLRGIRGVFTVVLSSSTILDHRWYHHFSSIGCRTRWAVIASKRTFQPPWQTEATMPNLKLRASALIATWFFHVFQSRLTGNAKLLCTSGFIYNAKFRNKAGKVKIYCPSYKVHLLFDRHQTPIFILCVKAQYPADITLNQPTAIIIFQYRVLRRIRRYYHDFHAVGQTMAQFLSARFYGEAFQPFFPLSSRKSLSDKLNSG